MSALADRFRREGMADAVVLLVAQRFRPEVTAEDWGRALGLQQHEVRAAIERFRARHTPLPARKQRPLADRRKRDAQVRAMAKAGCTADEIAAKVDLGVSRVRQILAKATA